MIGLPRNAILVGDAVDQLRQLPQASVDCVVTSPPYYLLRNYGAARQIGMEPSVDGWVENLQAVMAEVARVLKPTGSLWLNLGDSYSRNRRYGAPPKSLLLGPERLLLALVTDGWRVRNKAIWAKPNPMPTSVGDRLNTTYEVVYLLTRSARYFFDLDSIRVPHTSKGARRATLPIGKAPAWAGPLAGSQDGLRRARAAGEPGHALGKNPGDVWRVATHGYRGEHYATFPEALVRRPILATCPEAICVDCGLPWLRKRSVTDPIGVLVPCGCGSQAKPGIVLDPFMGTGTVGVVARSLGRDWLGIELNPEFARMAGERLAPSDDLATGGVKRGSASLQVVEVVRGGVVGSRRDVRGDPAPAVWAVGHLPDLGLGAVRPLRHPALTAVEASDDLRAGVVQPRVGADALNVLVSAIAGRLFTDSGSGRHSDAPLVRCSCRRTYRGGETTNPLAPTDSRILTSGLAVVRRPQSSSRPRDDRPPSPQGGPMLSLDSPSRLFIRPWLEPVPPPRFCATSHYVEYCWLPVLGPSTTWLYRHLGQLVSAHTAGGLVDLEELALDHGLGHGVGRNGPLSRSLLRMVRFGTAMTEDDILLVRPELPAVPHHQLARFTPQLRLIESHLRSRAEGGT